MTDHDLDGMKLLVGDARERLRDLPDESVHCVVTSPPYWALRRYAVPPVVWGGDPDHRHRWSALVLEANVSRGRTCSCGAWFGHLGLEPTPDLYVDHIVEVMQAVRRVLRRDGTVWLNLGDCYASKTRGSDTGWSKSRLRNPGYAQKAQAQSMRGSGERHRGKDSGLKEKDLALMPARVALALQDDGWWLRADVILRKLNGMPESAEDRPSVAHEHLFLLTRASRYYYDVHGATLPTTGGANAERRAAAPPRGRTRVDVSESIDRGRGGRWQEYEPYQPADRRLRSVWDIPTSQFPGEHYATFHVEVPEPCIKLGTSEKGVCPTCGAPWRRLVEKGEPELGANTWSANGAAHYDFDADDRVSRSLGDGSTLKHVRRVRTIGWEPTCSCTRGSGCSCPGPDACGGLGACRHNEPPVPVPATVLDPFAGSGTTLQAARRLRRFGLGIELSEEYAQKAIELRLTDWWRDPPRGCDQPVFDDDQLTMLGDPA